MLPIRDNIPGKKKPVITILIITINALIFLFQVLMPQDIERRFILAYGFIPDLMTRSILGKYSLKLALFSSFTGMFLHGGFLHLLSNMWMLWIFGDNVEDTLGHFRYLIFYLMSGFLATALNYSFSINSPIPVIGASGAIAGVMGAYFILFPRARIKTMFVPIFIIPLFLNVPAVIYLGLWFLIQLYKGAMDLMGSSEASSVAWWAHIGGFLGGVLLLKIFRRTKGYKSYG